MASSRALRAAAGNSPVETASYRLRIPRDVEGRIRRYRAPVRLAIQKHLAEIVSSAASQRSAPKGPAPKEPPLRFYVYDGYRIAYQLDDDTRHVVVLDLEHLPAA